MRAEPARLTCRVCGVTAEVDDAAVVHLTGRDLPWDAVPARLRPAVVRAGSGADVVESMLGGTDPWPRDLQLSLLHPSEGVAATLAPVRPGAVALDLATGWGTLATALASLGATVVSADWSAVRLRFGQLVHDRPAAQAVHLDPDAALPWSDRSFDVVFLDLADLPGGARRRAHLLAEVRRVLTPGGVLVCGMRAPLHGGPAGAGAALRRAGFTQQRTTVAYPRREGWQCLVPRERLRAHLATWIDGAGIRQRAKRALVTLGGHRLLERDRYVVAGTGTLPPTLGEQVLDGVDPPVTFSLSDARVALAGRSSFVKLPLSGDQQDAVVAEVRNTVQARRTPFAPFVVLSARVERWGPVPYARYPRVQQSDRQPGPAAVGEVLAALDTADRAPLHTTVFWQRLTGERGERDVRELGAEPLRDRVVRDCGRALVPVGPTHGDLHAGNVMLPRAGTPLLVDWNRFEMRNPLLLDAVYAAVEAHRQATGASLSRGILAFVDSRLAGPLAEHAGAVTGELDRLQAATVVLLDRIVSYSRPRRHHKPWTMPRFQAAVQALTQRWLDVP